MEAEAGLNRAGPPLPGRFFAGACPETLETMRRTGAVRILEPGAALFREGEAAASFSVILDGQVRIWRGSADGATLTVHLLSTGDVPGCVAVFRGIPYPASANAVTRTRVIGWPASALPALLAGDPALAANALSIVGERNAEMLDRLLEVATLGVEQRLARALLRLAARATPEGGDGTEIRISRQQLAELAATTLHTASRFIGRWEAAGIVAGGRGRITVRDSTRLAELAGSGTR